MHGDGENMIVPRNLTRSFQESRLTISFNGKYSEKIFLRREITMEAIQDILASRLIHLSDTHDW